MRGWLWCGGRRGDVRLCSWFRARKVLSPIRARPTKRIAVFLASRQLDGLGGSASSVDEVQGFAGVVEETGAERLFLLSQR